MRVWPQPLTASEGPTRVCVQCRQLTLPAQLNHTVNSSRLPDFFFAPAYFFFAGSKKAEARSRLRLLNLLMGRWCERHAGQ